MSKRRTPGDQVWIKTIDPATKETKMVLVVIPTEERWYPCLLGCSDYLCREWGAIRPVDPEEGEATIYYYISECEMFDPETSSSILAKRL